MWSKLRLWVVPNHDETFDDADIDHARRAGLRVIAKASVAALFGAAVTAEASAQRTRGYVPWWQRGRSRTR